MSMTLIGQFDSPFTRRVGITMTLYGLPFEHRPWSIFGDADKFRDINPLIRNPTLLIESGEVLIESAAIIDYLDSRVDSTLRLTPQAQPERYRVQQVVSLASGISDIAVRLFYEQRLHEQPTETYVARMTRQITQTLSVLEVERAKQDQDSWFANGMTQADIAVTCSLRHLRESQPNFVVPGTYPALEAHCERHEALPVFQAVSQAFIAPA